MGPLPMVCMLCALSSGSSLWGLPAPSSLLCFWLAFSRMHVSLCQLMSAAGLPAGLEGVIEESMAAPEGGFASMLGRHTEDKVLAGYW